jgi:hypothetical protein
MDTFYSSVRASECLRLFSLTLSDARDSRRVGKEGIRKRGSHGSTPGQASKSKYILLTTVNIALTSYTRTPNGIQDSKLNVSRVQQL